VSGDVTFPPVEERRWWNYIGPWPMRPVLMFVSSWYFFTVTAVGGMIYGAGPSIRDFLVDGFVQGLLSGLPIGVAMWMGRRWQRRHGVHWGSYLTFIGLAIVGALVIRYVFVIRFAFPTSSEALIPVAALRLFLLISLVLAVAGAVTERLQKQVIATAVALEDSRRQQEQILKADEDARRQVANRLHDRVQAGLMAACLELQALPGDEEERRQSITSIIRRLEGIRSIDVKKAARALSPSLQDVDLHAALRELGSQYEPGMVTYVDVSPEVENLLTDPEIRLGLYRITEQALLNSAVHGQAHHVEAVIRIIDNTSIHWEVRDDGRGLPIIESSPGLGSALMTTWMRRLGGEWTLNQMMSGGVSCRARIPLQQDPSHM
jgi:signal transduction histidine kinase